jgi:hypothetical protein
MSVSSVCLDSGGDGASNGLCTTGIWVGDTRALGGIVMGVPYVKMVVDLDSNAGVTVMGALEEVLGPGASIDNSDDVGGLVMGVSEFTSSTDASDGKTMGALEGIWGACTSDDTSMGAPKSMLSTGVSDVMVMVVPYFNGGRCTSDVTNILAPEYDDFRGDTVVVHTTTRTIENYSAHQKGVRERNTCDVL